MTIPHSMEFWVAILLIINFMVVVFLFLTVKRINRLRSGLKSKTAFEQDPGESDLTSNTTARIVDLLEPLVEESRQTAIRFDDQIKEKKRLIKELNEALDSRIISVNLLLSRADAQQRKLQERRDRFEQQQKMSQDYAPQNLSPPPENHQVDDQQNRILALYYQNVDIDTIASKLSIPKGEVRLVIDLKEKFMAMEKDSQ